MLTWLKECTSSCSHGWRALYTLWGYMCWHILQYQDLETKLDIRYMQRWIKLWLKIWNHVVFQELGTRYRRIVGFWIHMGSFLQVMAAVFFDSFTNDSIFLRDKWCCYANKRVDADFWHLVKYGNWDANSSNLHRTWSSINCTHVNFAALSFRLLILMLSAIFLKKGSSASTYGFASNTNFRWQSKVIDLTK